MNYWTHIPVLAKEAAELLLRKPDGVYVDGTLGLGGHAAYFLSLLGPQARLFGFDKDEEALVMARTRVNDPRLTAVHASYTQAPQVLREAGLDGADGVLFDLGLSSYQLDNPARGFSLLRDGPLDMRFDLSAPLTAAQIVNEWPLADLERILNEYGEEKNAHAIAMAVMAARRQGTYHEGAGRPPHFRRSGAPGPAGQRRLCLYPPVRRPVLCPGSPDPARGGGDRPGGTAAAVPGRGPGGAPPGGERGRGRSGRGDGRPLRASG